MSSMNCAVCASTTCACCAGAVDSTVSQREAAQIENFDRLFELKLCKGRDVHGRQMWRHVIHMWDDIPDARSSRQIASVIPSYAMTTHSCN